MSNRPMPCPDCGSPVQPERDQLCPRCGYPLMFLRRDSAADDARAQSVPRSPNEHDDPTSLRAVPHAVPHPRTETRQFPAASYGSSAGAPCRACGYPNGPARIRCERCGDELRPARPEARILMPAAPQQQPHRAGWGWLIALIVIAVLAVLVLAGVLLWRFLG